MEARPKNQPQRDPLVFAQQDRDNITIITMTRIGLVGIRSSWCWNTFECWIVDNLETIRWSSNNSRRWEGIECRFFNGWRVDTGAVKTLLVWTSWSSQILSTQFRTADATVMLI